MLKKFMNFIIPQQRQSYIVLALLVAISVLLPIKYSVLVVTSIK